MKPLSHSMKKVLLKRQKMSRSNMPNSIGADCKYIVTSVSPLKSVGITGKF